MSAAEVLSREFAQITDVVREHARERPAHPALVEDGRQVDYAELDRLMDRVAAALQRDGVAQGEVVAVCAATSIAYAAGVLGVLRAGAIVAPLAPASTPQSLVAQLDDCGAKLLFLDMEVSMQLSGVLDQVTAVRISLDGSAAGIPLGDWQAPEGEAPRPVDVAPDQGFNIIYSSGTTGAPKGIVQPHSMRWGHVTRGAYLRDAVTMISTPLYSNTTLVSFFPTIANGGTAILMAKFDAETFLRLSQAHRATHAMLVPVQYRRLMAQPDFDAYDLSSYQLKFCTSAPFAASLKADVLKRWPGGLVEFYGMTEGGGSCMLEAHKHPDKLHTVGQPMPGHDIRLIGEDGREVAHGEIGEVVGRSRTMMKGYHNLPDKTAEAEWWSPEGLRFIRTGDIGRFDDDCFLTLMDRKKDMIISGGFNVYPSDLEAELLKHEAVSEAAVVGAPSARWGETPVAFVVLKPGASVTAAELRATVNQALGKTQRLSDLVVVASLPRSAIGKVLKRDLRGAYRPPETSAA